VLLEDGGVGAGAAATVPESTGTGFRDEDFGPSGGQADGLSRLVGCEAHA